MFSFNLKVLFIFFCIFTLSDKIVKKSCELNIEIRDKTINLIKDSFNIAKREYDKFNYQMVG